MEGRRKISRARLHVPALTPFTRIPLHCHAISVPYASHASVHHFALLHPAPCPTAFYTPHLFLYILDLSSFSSFTHTHTHLPASAHGLLYPTHLVLCALCILLFTFSFTHLFLLQPSFCIFGKKDKRRGLEWTGTDGRKRRQGRQATGRRDGKTKDDRIGRDKTEWTEGQGEQGGGAWSVGEAVCGRARLSLSLSSSISHHLTAPALTALTCSCLILLCSLSLSHSPSSISPSPSSPPSHLTTLTIPFLFSPSLILSWIHQ